MSTTTFDPILVEVLNNELASVTEEMAIVIWKTGRSPMIKTGDFATAVCDARGRVVGLGFAAPFQLAALQELIESMLLKYGRRLSAGDVIISNDPYAGMTHMPDVAVATPVVIDDELVGFCVAYSHHSDIGGRFAGGFSSKSGTTYEEGLRLPTVKLAEAGATNDAVLDIIRANVRVSDEFIADLDAKMAGCLRGVGAMTAMIARYGLDTFNGACDHLVTHAERAMRAAIATVAPGVYEHADRLADDGVSEDGGIDLRLRLRIEGEELVADFSGSSDQVESALNLPATMTRAAVYGAVKSIIGADVPANAGFFRPLRVVAPEGSIVNPRFPAAVGGRAPVFYRIFDLVYRALAMAMPGRVPVSAEGGDVLHFTGTAPSGGPFALLDVYFGGWGGRVTKDGIDGVAPVYMGSYGTVPVEVLERQFPLVIESFGFVTDSEGAGRFRGSLSIERRWRFLQGGEAMIRTIRLAPAEGLYGGCPGQGAETVLIRAGVNRSLPLKTHVHLHVEPGDRVVHRTGGSGGYGDPFGRDPHAVLEDVRSEKVTARHAEEAYGVLVDEATGGVDAEATVRLRREPRAGL